jgi:hypothetical protein
MNHREDILLARLADKQGKLLQETRDYADQIRLSGKYSKAEERALIKEVEQFEEKIYDDWMEMFKARKDDDFLERMDEEVLDEFAGYAEEKMGKAEGEDG